MEIKINISDDQMENILKNEVNSLSREQLHEVILEGCKNYLMSESGFSFIKDVCVKKSPYYGSSTDLQDWLKNYLTKSIETSSFGEEIKKIGDLIVNELKENHRDVLNNFLLHLFLSSLNRGLFNSGEFNSNLQGQIQQIIYMNKS